MTIEEAHDLCSLAMLRPVVIVGIDQIPPFVVDVGVDYADGTRLVMGRGEGATRDEAFVAAMTRFAERAEVRAASRPS